MKPVSNLFGGGDDDDDDEDIGFKPKGKIPSLPMPVPSNKPSTQLPPPLPQQKKPNLFNDSVIS
jgi:hypothetical protein